MFSNLYSATSSVLWPGTSSSGTAVYIEKEEKKDPHHALAISQKWPKVARRQFAMRFLAPHINNTSLEGSYSEMSAAYWCSLLDLWLSGEGNYIPFKIDVKLLAELKEILQDTARL